ncbi:MAG TPA: malto-oligosyltrehalose synthase, partial [Verrucomicrobiae bacterium]|nr:malto-oligosyltrehalose synthase [Verrucomicrobiae bacterium]
AVLSELNGRPGKPESFHALDALLRQQFFRLAYWRTASEEINYRRFFDVAELVSLRVELPEVFEAAHRFVFQLVRAGDVTGLRVDHPDGLWDPSGYFERLQDEFAAEPAEDPDLPEGASAAAEKNSGVYTVAEKILAAAESLPDDWQVDGSTGYDFLNEVNGLFVDPAGETEFERIYTEFTGNRQSFRAIACESKKRIVETSLASELNALTRRLKDVSALTRYGVDFTASQLRRAVVEVIACFPVYRAYVNERTARPTRAERQWIRQAGDEAKRTGRVDPGAVEFLCKILSLDLPPDAAERARPVREFIMRFQQLTGPAAAKGIEDTAFYNYNRLVSLNEVGGDPARFGISPGEFHERNLARADRWPHSLLATATHDTKRGEDLRARLNVLSEIPAEWESHLRRWSELNAPKKTSVSGQPAPHPNDEYLFHQILIGAWTSEAESRDGLESLRERLVAYMLKAIREAKARTSWTDPNAAYEKAVEGFVSGVLAGGAKNRFLADFKPFQARVAFFGALNSLSQTVLKLACPGVPDIYQGCELWDFNLVDPDNRRPVDFGRRAKLLRELKMRQQDESAQGLLRGLRQRWETGEEKLWLIWRMLRCRNEQRELFEKGNYVPLRSTGRENHHLCAFARTHGGQMLIVLAPRLFCGLLKGAEREPLGKEIWGDTRITVPATTRVEKFQNVLTGETVKASDQSILAAGALASFPVAVLFGKSSGGS